MKRKIKTLITAFAVSAVSAFAVMASGCGGVPEWLEQARCTHKWNDGEVTKAATCEDVGEKTVTCTLCGYEDIEYIPATGHAWINTDAVEPTCTQVGQMAGIRCATCAEWFIEATEVPATGHVLVTDEGKPATCTETGLTDGEHCAVCDEVITAQEEVPANGHKTVTVEGKEPTCTEKGLTDGQACETCGVTLSAQEEIPMLACADEDGDGYCDVCNSIMPLAEGTYTEVAATVGETVVGNWYRFYPASDAGVNRIELSLKMLVSDYGYSDAQPITVGMLYNSFFGITMGGMLTSMVEEQNSIMDVVFHDGYVDVYFKEGTLTQEDLLSPNAILESSDPVTEETTITFIGGTVYRLQVNE